MTKNIRATANNVSKTFKLDCPPNLPAVSDSAGRSIVTYYLLRTVEPVSISHRNLVMSEVNNEPLSNQKIKHSNCRDCS